MKPEYNIFLAVFFLFSSFGLSAQGIKADVNQGAFQNAPMYPNYLFNEKANVFVTIKNEIEESLESEELYYLGNDNDFVIGEDGDLTTKAGEMATIVDYPREKGWYRKSLSPNKIEAFYYNGLNYQSAERVWCLVGTGNYTISVTRDGGTQIIAPFFTEKWTEAFRPIGGRSYCGSPTVVIEPQIGYTVNPPGVYTFSISMSGVSYPTTSSVTNPACTTGVLPLYTSRYTGNYHNSYMSTDYALHLSALSQGYVSAGIVAKLEPSQLRGDIAHPFSQFFNQGFINHYYGWRPEDIAYVLSDGWRHERVEGYIYSTQVSGTVPLYSLWRNWNGSWDVEHRYTTNISERNQWVAQGFNYHSIMGYVCP